jgi:sortase B
MAVLALIVVVLASGSWALYDSSQVYAAADAKRWQAYRPDAQKGQLSFSELQKINPEVISWLEVYGTAIDYPVVQSVDNMKYVNTDAAGNYSLTGSIFLDAQSSADFSDFSSILYGHHMDKSAMFGELGLFSDERYFSERRYGRLHISGRDVGLESVAFLHTDAYDSEVFRTGIATDAPHEIRQACLDVLISRAMHIRIPDISTDDRFVLLSTCSAASTNGRDVLVMRITDEVADNPFLRADDSTAHFTTDSLSGLWAALPLWAKTAAGLFLFAVLLFAVFLLKRKGNRQKDDRTVASFDRSIPPPVSSSPESDRCLAEMDG